MAVTQQDVAARAGVSVATVSLVLRGQAQGRASHATRERVVKAARDLEYVGNASASSLRTRTSRTIALLSDRMATTPNTVQMLRAANDAARQAGYTLLLLNTDNQNPEDEREAVRALSRLSITTVVFASMFHRQVRLPAGLPDNTVVLDGFTNDPSTTSIVPDDYQGARDAVEHLIAHGHTRIAMLNEPASTSTAARLRSAAYWDALEDACITLDPSLYETADHIPGVSDAAAGRLLDRAHPTAIFCFNDEAAAGVYREARRRGLSIPADLSVVGFDNFELIARHLDPPMTTVQLPHAAMGRWAVEVALGRRTVSAPYPYRQRCPLVVRESVTAPRHTQQPEHISPQNTIEKEQT